jgi:hypothetical protein
VLSVVHYWLADSQSLSAKVVGEVFNRPSAHQQQQQQQQTQTTKTTATAIATTTTTTTTTITTTTTNNNSKNTCISQYAVIKHHTQFDQAKSVGFVPVIIRPSLLRSIQ